MSSGNDNDGVLRRMVKRVATPARDLVGLGAPDTLSHDSAADLEKAELKAMIERKRRNDFVRKRELDMLRRIRREGLTAEQAQALGASSRLDDSDVRPSQPPGPSDMGVKAKIDAIEKQMVGAVPPLPRPEPPRPAPPPYRPGNLPTLTAQVDAEPTVPAGLVTDGFDVVTEPMAMAAPATPEVAPARAVAPPAPAPTMPPAAVAPASHLPAMEVSEILHDQELDEAVIAFANADFTHCEDALTRLIGAQGRRQGHLDTWLALFDLYRATGQHGPFEALAMAFSERFQRSAPQWYSLPRLVAEATRSGVGRQRDAGAAPTPVGWVCPALLDVDAVVQLSSQTMQLPLPWVLDWSPLQRVDTHGAVRLRALMRQWATQTLDMRWLGAERLLGLLQDAAPVGVRDADPALWLLRMEALRLVNRPDQFDDAAIDYCVTYEVSPPSWEPTRCVARMGGAAPLSTRSAALSAVGDAVTTLQDIHDGAGTQAVTTLELMGQLSGDIGPLLGSLNAKLGGARLVRISCALLIRADFVAASDLLNWVVSKRNESRQISFTDVHRLVGLMFSAMGLNEQASVQLRQS
jgi:ABC-type transporter Mla MlaB component